MPTTYTDQAYAVDILAVNSGDFLTVISITLTDTDDNGEINVGETINGFIITAVYVGDTVEVNGVLITGVTFITAGGPFFTPTDSSILVDGTAGATETVVDSTFLPISELGPPCFVTGSLILTPSGEVPVETLRAGDKVVTQSNGVQTLLWVGRTCIRGTDQFAPVRFEVGAYGNSTVLEVSQQHRMLSNSALNKLHFGAQKVLVPAKFLAGRPGINIVPRRQVDYVHIMCAQHEIVCSNGIWSESYFYGAQEVDGFDLEVRKELDAIFSEAPYLGSGFTKTAHYCVKSYEAMLVSQ